MSTLALRVTGLTVVAMALFLALLFLPAGRLDWWEGWVYFGVTMGPTFLLMFRVGKRNPELGRRRLSIGEGTKGWDALLLVLLKLTFFSALVLGALDSGRYGWCVLPAWLVPLGGVLVILGVALLGWSMVTNTHFETTVRIQHDRDHRVVTGGPYAIVRHPGYAAFLLLAAGTALVFRSGWSVIPIVASIVVMAVRTALEDRLLQRELEGYAAYASRVRFRWIPGVW